MQVPSKGTSLCREDLSGYRGSKELCLNPQTSGAQRVIKVMAPVYHDVSANLPGARKIFLGDARFELVLDGWVESQAVDHWVTGTGV